MQKIWGEKPYRSLDWQLKTRFGEKVYKLALNGGMGCPNRDGKVGRGGCIFCSEGGREKKPARKYIAYFQAYTNTYAPTEYLEQIFTEAIEDPEVVILSIATRPDCLPEDVLDLLAQLNRQKPVWVELGLQTMHEESARMIHRGYDLACFEQAVRGLRSREIDVIVHTILGLPGEGNKEVFHTIDYLNHMDIQGIKLQLLHILKGTQLGQIYLEQQEGQEFVIPVTMEAYIDLVISCVEHLSPEITIHRLTGDGPKDLLLAPMWSTRKRTVLNEIHKEMKKRDAWQGKRYERTPL